MVASSSQTPLEVCTWTKQLFDGIARHATSVKSSCCVLSLVSLSFWLSLLYVCDIPSPALWQWTLPSLLFFSPLTTCISAFILLHSFSSSAPTTHCLALELWAKLKIFPSFSDVWACSPQPSGSARPEEMSVAGTLSPSDQLL